MIGWKSVFYSNECDDNGELRSEIELVTKFGKLCHCDSTIWKKLLPWIFWERLVRTNKNWSIADAGNYLP